MSDKITPPWDEETIGALNRFQFAGHMHPFTCPREHFTEGEALLIARPSGWVCSNAPACGYTQDWAHAFMAEELPASSDIYPLKKENS